VTASLAKQVRPDLGFEDHHDGWLDGAHRATDGKDIVNGDEEHAIGKAGQFIFCGGVACESAAGDQHGRVLQARTEAADQFDRGDDFANGNRMQPNRAGNGLDEMAGKEAGSLGESCAVRRRAPGTEREIQ